jgi:hypothetical protein
VIIWKKTQRISLPLSTKRWEPNFQVNLTKKNISKNICENINFLALRITQQYNRETVSFMTQSQIYYLTLYFPCNFKYLIRSGQNPLAQVARWLPEFNFFVVESFNATQCHNSVGLPPNLIRRQILSVELRKVLLVKIISMTNAMFCFRPYVWGDVGLFHRSYRI